MSGKRGMSRRTLIEWLGKGAVLALGAPLIEACGGTSPMPSGPDAALPAFDAGAPPFFPFAPGSGAASIFANWKENTVDQQDLAAILSSWTLTVDGLVAQPITYRFADLATLPRQDQITDFFCVEGWTVPDVPWNGVTLAALIDASVPDASATHLTFHTVDDIYNESLPIAVAREPKSLLAYGIDDATMPLAHGFPMRVVVPRLLGYKNAKYVNRVELANHPVAGFWVKAGYPYAGEVPADRLRPGKY